MTVRKKKMFTTSGTFTVPVNVVGSTIYVSGCAGGGGGSSIYGCGGGGGQSMINRAVSVTPGQVINITIGAGGMGSTAKSDGGSLFAGIVQGQAGGDTIFGSITLKGGKQGYCDSNVAHYNGGAAGGENASQGGILCTSLYMEAGNIYYQGGSGGSSLFGVGGTGGTATYVNQTNQEKALTQGSDGVGFGAGGGGGGTWQHTSTDSKYSRAGNGTSGVIIVEWEE